MGYISKMESYYCFLILTLQLSFGACYVEDDVQTLLQNIETLTRQIMMQQFFMEEHIRATGSGIRQVRANTGGNQPYFTESLSSSTSYMTLHSHFSHKRLLGMGEVQVVMNGVDFRTHHNDFLLVQPDQVGSEFQSTKEIPLPDVPPEVLSKQTVEEQVEEMREWFRAFKEQDYSIRDYRQYFKPVICYLEGYWVYPAESFEDDYPFSSNSEANGASEWDELHGKVRFKSYSGTKGIRENLAHLPTKIMDIVNKTIPVFAQWTYRPMCHPLRNDLPTSRFHLVDDLTVRIKKNLTKMEYSHSRFARYNINPRNTAMYVDERISFGLLDELMGEIPGLDGYGASLVNNLFGTEYTYQVNGTGLNLVNSAYYHRWSKSNQNDAMGINIRHAGFSDPNIFMAMSSQPRVAGMSTSNRCLRDKDGERFCRGYDYQRWTYALPLEIVYMTPLSQWNPYDILHHGDRKSPDGKVVTKDGRDGSLSESKAFNGTNSDHYHITPSSFYDGSIEDTDPADTGDNLHVGVLNSMGDLVEVAASGFRLKLPKITGVGTVRQRYPIAQPVMDGNNVYKELYALKQLVLNSDSYQNMFSGVTPLRRTNKTLMLGPSANDEIGEHTHVIKVTADEVRWLENTNNHVEVYTSYELDHSHTLKITHEEGIGYSYVLCDMQKDGQLCHDKHPLPLIEVTDSESTS